MPCPIGAIVVEGRDLAAAVGNELRSQGGHIISVSMNVLDGTYEIWVEHEMIQDKDWCKVVKVLAQGRCNLDDQQGT